MAILYSTHELHPRDRLAYWLDVATKSFVRHDFRSSSGASFLGRIRAGQLAGLGVAAVESDPCEVNRSARHVARDDGDYLLLSLLLEGRSGWEQDCRQAASAPGGIVLLDTRRPFAVSADAITKSITLTIPRYELEARIGSLVGLTAQTMNVDAPIVRLATGFLAMLPDRVDAFSDLTAAKIASQALDLVALALTTETQRSVKALSSSRGIALLRLKSAIEARLADPSLKPGDAAAAARISVRYANALLAHDGTSVERYILSRRLERCRRALEDPEQSHRMISDIAFGWGFSDLSHFCRRFKDEYGCSPSDYRKCGRS